MGNKIIFNPFTDNFDYINRGISERGTTTFRNGQTQRSVIFDKSFPDTNYTFVVMPIDASFPSYYITDKQIDHVILNLDSALGQDINFNWFVYWDNIDFGQNQCLDNYDCDAGNCETCSNGNCEGCDAFNCYSCNSGNCEFSCPGCRSCDGIGNCFDDSGNCDSCSSCENGECVSTCVGCQSCDGEGNCFDDSGNCDQNNCYACSSANCEYQCGSECCDGAGGCTSC